MRIDTRNPSYDRELARKARVFLDGAPVDKGLCFLADDEIGEVGLFEKESGEGWPHRLRMTNGRPAQNIITGNVEVIFGEAS